MQMNLGEAENKLTALKDQYENNPLAINEIDHALSELNGIKTLRVSEEEKRRKVAQLAETKTKLAQKDKFKQSTRGIIWNGAKTVASATGTVLGFIASILLNASQGSGPAGIYVATQMGPNPARIGGTKRHTKRR
jgi:F0F1-type ATP synthase assembly protein I